MIIKLIAITVIWVLGVKIVTSEGMLLERVGKYAEGRSGLIWKPLIMCVWCMPSIHSLVAYIFGIGLGVITHFSWHVVIMYPLVVMASSFLCGISWGLMELIDVATIHHKNAGEREYLDVKDRKRNYNKNKWQHYNP